MYDSGNGKTWKRRPDLEREYAAEDATKAKQ